MKDTATKTVQIPTQHNELLSLMLKKADLDISDIFEVSYKLWINQNTDLLTEEEKEKYKHLFLGKI